MLDIKAILEYLPHRYPFLLIDRVIEFEAKKRIVAIKNVTINEPFFTGHFPGNPVMPGVLIIEALAQAGGVLCLASMGVKKHSLVYLMGLDKVKFRAPVTPGDQLRLEVCALRTHQRGWKMGAQAFVGSNLVAEGMILARAGGDQPETSSVESAACCDIEQ
ncbi:MAG: 3-hydroxyacyl-ACP dehydratase FabZ [bacterium]|nr:3-hydroxyacyl-ACP dehydratase FabZ [bacterium]